MERKYTCLILLAAAAVAACSLPDAQHNEMQAGDSTDLISRHEALEKVIRDYYDSVEDNVRKDLGGAVVTSMGHG